MGEELIANAVPLSSLVKTKVIPDKLYKVTQWQKVTYLVKAPDMNTATLLKAIKDPVKCVARVGFGELYGGDKIVGASEATLEDIDASEPVKPDLKVDSLIV